MKRLLESRLLSAAVLTALGIALSLAPGRSSIPPLSLENAAEMNAILPGRPRREVLSAWGQPDGRLSGFWGEVYDVEEGFALIVYYDMKPLSSGACNSSGIPVQAVKLYQPPASLRDAPHFNA